MCDGQITDTVDIKPFIVFDAKTKPSGSYKKQEVDSFQIQINKSRNLSDLLSQNTSVFIKTYGGGGLASATIRGTGTSHSKLYWNGILVNQSTLGSTDLALFPIAFLDEAEVHYGASGIVDGAGGMGGSILLSTNSNSQQKQHISVSQRIGNFNDYRTVFTFKKTFKKLYIKVGLLYVNSKNNFSYKNISLKEAPVQRQKNSEIQQYGLLGELYYNLSSNSQLIIRCLNFYSNRNLPGLMTTPVVKDNQIDNGFKAILEWNKKLNYTTILVRSSYVDDYLHYYNSSSDISYDYFVRAVRNQFNIKKKLGEKIYITGNINLDYDWVRSAGFNKLIDQSRASIFVSADYFPFDFVKLNGLVRQEIIDTKPIPLIPSIGIRLQPLKSYLVYLKGNYARNYNTPTLNQKYWNPGGNINLLPEQGTMSEVGVAGTIKRSNKSSFNLEVTYYNSRIKNWIVWLPVSSTIWSPRNINEVINKGYEVEIGTVITIKNLTIKLNGGYNYTSSITSKVEHGNDNSLDKQLIFVPYHTVHNNLSISFNNAYLTYNHAYTGKRFITSDNKTYMPYNTVGNFFAGYTFEIKKSQLAVQGEINNLWNEQYQTIPWRPMPGRNYAVTLKYILSKE